MVGQNCFNWSNVKWFVEDTHFVFVKSLCKMQNYARKVSLCKIRALEGDELQRKFSIVEETFDESRGLFSLC